MHVHMSMCVTRIPSAGGFACPGDGVETARSRTTCSCWTYVREPVLKSAAVLCRGRGLGDHGWRCWAVRRARRPSLRASTVVRRAARSCAVWRMAHDASQRPCVPRPNTRGGHGGHGPRRRPRRRCRGPRPGAAVPTPGAPGRTGNSILAKMVQGPFCFRGDHRSAHAPTSLFDARQRLRTRTSAVPAPCCLVCVSLDVSAISRCSAVLQCSSSREPVPHTVAEALGALGAPQTSQHTSPCCPVAAASAARPASDAC